MMNLIFWTENEDDVMEMTEKKDKKYAVGMSSSAMWYLNKSLIKFDNNADNKFVL